MTRKHPASLIVVPETPTCRPRFQRCDLCKREVVIAVGGFELWQRATETVWRFAGYYDEHEVFSCGQCRVKGE